MADNHINFKLGSSFDGQGFNAAQKAIDANKKEINSARAGLGDLAKAFDGMNPAVGKVAGSVAGFAQAFVTGGIVGGVIQLGIAGISKAFEFCTEMIDKAKERAKKFTEISGERIKEFATSATERLKRMGEQFAELKRSADSFNNVLRQAIDSDTNEKVYQIAVDKLQSITDDMTERERAVIEAQAALKTAIVKNSAAHEKASVALSEATTARKNSEEMVKQANIANANAQAALKMAMDDTQISEEHYKAVRDAATQAVKNLSDAEIKLRNAKTAETKAAEDEVEASRKLTLAKLEGEQKVRDAEAKRQQEIDELAKKEREAAEKKAEAEAKAAEKIEKDQESWDNFMIQQREKLENALGAPKSVSDILDEFDKILKDGAEDLLGDSGEDGEPGDPNRYPDPGKKKDKPGRGGNGGAGGAGGNAVIPNPLNVNVQNPGAFGNAGNQAIAPFKEVQKQQRELERAQRDLVSELNGKLGGEMSQFFRLLGTPESARSALENALVNHYKYDVIPTMTRNLGTEFTAKFLQDQASHVLMKKDLEDFFNDEKALKTVLEGVKSNTAGIDNMATQIHAAVAALKDVVVL